MRARILALLQELENLFQRKVDLVEVSAVCNPYIRRNIESSQVSLYAA
jgi:predicted nucleotidyltransferase